MLFDGSEMNNSRIPFVTNFINEHKKLILVIKVLLFLGIGNVYGQGLLLNQVNKFLNNEGVNLEIDYTSEIFSNLYGGIKRNTDYLHNLDVIFDFDMNKIIGWNDASINLYILGNHGGIPNEQVGTIQGVSNIAAHNTWKLYELWLEQKFFNEKLSFLFGLYDLNSEFDVRETSSIFINPSHGIGPEFSLTGKNGPSIFPTTSLAIRLKYNFSDSFSIKSTILDGIPGDIENPNNTQVMLGENDGLLIAAELTFANNSESNYNNYFKYGIGGWFYTEKFETFPNSSFENRVPEKGNYGLYGFAESHLISENKNGEQGLAGFVRFGITNKNVNKVCTYYGTGINYLGLIPGRDDEILGLAIGTSKNSNDFRISQFGNSQTQKTKTHEYIIELTYKINLLDYLSIQPDVQYVINPTFSQKDSAFLLGVRAGLKL
jgi:porin